MAINKNAPAPLTGALQPQAGAPSALASLGGTTQALRAVQQAATGRARQAGPIQEDIIQEQVALQEAEASQQVMQEQGRLLEAGAEMQRAEQEQQFKFNLEEMNEKQVNASQELMNRSLSILQDFEQGRAKLELGKDKARMEQALFGMRLSNKKYVDQLEIEGRKRRLDNAVQFKEALTETLFKEELDLLKSDISFKRKLAGDEREFAALLESIDLDTALRLVMQESEAANIALIAQGSKEIISGATKYYAGQKEAPEAPEEE
jgi:hypothetical protein